MTDDKPVSLDEMIDRMRAHLEATDRRHAQSLDKGRSTVLPWRRLRAMDAAILANLEAQRDDGK